LAWVSPFTKRITSAFGPRSGCGNCSKNHGAIDIAEAGIEGTPAVAFMGGEVIKSEASGTTFYSTLEKMGTGYGYYVAIDHGDGIESRYAHLERLGIPVGTKVKAGEVVGS